MSDSVGAEYARAVAHGQPVSDSPDHIQNVLSALNERANDSEFWDRQLDRPANLSRRITGLDYNI